MWLFKMSPCANDISKYVPVQIFFQNNPVEQGSSVYSWWWQLIAISFLTLCLSISLRC